MSRVPIRVRLAALLAPALALVLSGAGLFVYLRLAGHLDEGVDAALEARATAVAASGQVAAGDLGDDEDGIAQRLAGDGRVRAAVGGDGSAALTPAEARRAASGGDVATEDGEPVEITEDFYAQDRRGTVWYLGEDTAEYENGRVVSREGSFEAGVDGAEAGVIMPAHPRPGLRYREEHYGGSDREELLRFRPGR